MLKSYLITFALFFPVFGFSQYYLTGQDPASVRWRQIKTENFQIIFPKEYSRMAQYYANVLELSGKHVKRPYIEKQKPVTIILHNRSTLSNAMVSPAPFHADFFEMPSQDLYPQIWQDQLALHEYRHVVQMTKIKSGFTKGLYYLFGDQGVAAVFGTFLPFWFIEGDAVFSETVHSKSGRGRVPGFSYKLKAQVLDKKIYKYDKAQFGSYKNFVPDHYTLGYQLVTYGTSRYGISMWNDILCRVARKPFTLVPFTYGLKKSTGNGKVNFYNKTLDSLKVQWQKSDPAFTDSLFKTENRFYTDYLFPQPLSDGSVICEKASIDDIRRFVKVFPDGSEKPIYTPGFDFKESLWANDSLICWNEKSFDIRWSNRDYSVIKIYDFKNRKIKTVTRKSRYFAPAVSGNLKYIAASEITETGQNNLVILDFVSGKKIKTFATPGNLLFMTPRWANDNKHIAAIVLGKNGKKIIVANIETGDIKTVLPYTFAEIKQPAIYDDYIVFSGTFEGKDELFAVRISDGKIFKLLNARFGSVNPVFSADGKKIFYSAYTSDGFKPAVSDFIPENLKVYNKKTVPAFYPVDKLVSDTTFVLDNVKVPDSIYNEKKYSRIAHLFNPYAWGPLYIDADNYSFQPGVSLLSQNKLSTAVTSLGYLYDINEQTGKVKFGFDYYGWYPVISINASYGGRRQFANDGQGQMQEVRWKETDISAAVSFPLNFTKSKWIKGINPSAKVHQRFLSMEPGSKFSFKEERLTIAAFQLYGYIQQKKSKKDIFPRYGMWINGLYRKTLFSDSSSEQMSLQGALFLPGVLKHHGIRIYTAFQNNIEGYYNFGHTVSMPRGYTGLQPDRCAVIKADYALPLFYPDWNVPAVFYLKRVYSRLFYDYLYDIGNNGQGDVSAAGVEIYSGWHFLSLFPEVNLGIRFSYLIENNGNAFEFLYSVSF